MNRKLKYAVTLAVFAFIGIGACWQMEKDRSVVTYDKDNLIRFHVIANSNTAEDQALKYQVRDVIVNSMAERFEGVQDVTEARVVVQNSLDDIRDLAAGFVQSRGYDYPVTVSLGDYPFPTKSYNLGETDGKTNFLTLPADTYEAVRVVLGEGKGANWWCVLFPPLCFVDFHNTQATTRVPESLPVTSVPDTSELEPGPDLLINEPPEQDGNEEDQQKEAVTESHAVEAFKLTAPSKAQLEGLTGANNDRNTGNSSIQLRFKCVELYNHTLNWFSRTFGASRV